MARTMLEETKMKIGKEQIDRLPDTPLWREGDCAKFFACGAIFGFLVGLLASSI